MYKTDKQSVDANAVIDALGGPAQTARECDDCITSQAVSGWRKNGIPDPWRKYLQLKRPDVFDNQQNRKAA